MPDELLEQDYQVVITDIGLSKIEALMAGQSVIVTEMGFGDAYGEAYKPVSTQIALKHELFRKPIASRDPVEGIVKYKSILLSTDPSGDFIELGLYDSDGDLFAVANIPRLEHRTEASGAVTETEVSMVFLAENASQVTIQVPSAIYVTHEYADTYYLRTDGLNYPTTDISINNQKLTNIKSGTEMHDAATIHQLEPIGTVSLWSGLSTPDYAHDCDGAEYKRIGEDENLFAVIGVLYGEGDGDLTFNVPNIPSPVPNVPLRYIIRYKH